MASQWLTTYFARYTIERIMIMPSLKKLWFWDFVLEAKDDYFVGRIGIVSRKITICANLPKQRYSLIVEQAQKTTLAEFFNLFTPFAYFEARQQEGTTLIQIFDLRYYQKNGFLHSGLIVFKGDETATESYMRSYGRQLKFPA
jgi:inner membrane protein